MAKKLKAAVIGCGRAGFGFDLDPKRHYPATHSGAYHVCKTTELTAVCDPDVARLQLVKKRYPKTAVYSDLSAMLKNETLDLVSICTPPATHLEVLKQVLNYPVKGVFCEKPVAADVKQADQMLALAKKKKIVLQINHQRRFDKLHRGIVKAAQGGRWGKLQQGNFYYTAGIYNTGSHMFDLIQYVSGPVKSVTAFFHSDSNAEMSDPNVNGMLEMKDGGFFTFQALDVKLYMVFELNAFFEKARLKILSSGWKGSLQAVCPSPYYKGYRELKEIKFPFNTDYQREFFLSGVEELSASVREKRASISTGADGRASLAVIEAALKSAKSGGRRIQVK